MNQSEFEQTIDDLSEDTLLYLAQSSMPWSNPSLAQEQAIRDEDGFSVNPFKDFTGLPALQNECWNKFVDNPQINSHVRDFMGSLTGFGFEVESGVHEIQEVLEEIIEDPRNALYSNMPKYVARSEIEGELFLCLALHTNGFIEVDFMDPSSLKGGGDNNSGIYFHPEKQTMPLMYRFESDTNGINLIPSINIAYYPEMYRKLKSQKSYNREAEKNSRTSSRKYSKIGGFKRFIIAWDRGFLTKRNVSHIRTTITWINHYENLKKWEIDHKKSSGAYLWVVSMEDSKAYRTWLKLTDEQKQSTGLYAKKTPGGTLVLPPGISIECKNPNLPKISEADTDIMHMVTSGLNKPEDMVTGVTKGSTFSGIKASRGPQSDRTADEIAYFERFLRYDFWRGIFFLRSSVTDFPTEFEVQEATEFVDKEPKMQTLVKKIHKLITFEFPTSEVTDAEAKARAYLGVKHPSVIEVLGIPREDVAKKLGFGSYKKKRLLYSTEAETLPDLPTTAELETQQAKSQEGSVEGTTKKESLEPTEDE